MNKQRIEELVIRAQQHDEDAFVELYNMFYHNVYGAAYKLCRNDADAKDATQMAFIQAHKSLHTLQQPAYFPLWINHIAVNKCKNMFRNKHEDLYDDEYFRLGNRFVDKNIDANATSYTHYQSDRKVIEDLIKQLPLDQQQVLDYTYFKQMGNDETAAALNIAVGTVKSRLYAARTNLRKKVELYEKKEGIKLDFKEEALGGILLTQLLQTETAKPFALPFLSRFSSKGSSLLSGAATQTMVLVTCGTLAIGGGAFAYKQYKDEQNNSKEVAQEIIKTAPFSTPKSESFSTMKVMERSIETTQDAYFLLRGWAYDVQAMEKKDASQITEMIPLYNELKQQGGEYYKLLESIGWTASFEKVANLK